MIQDVYEPLGAYRDEFKEKFARLTRDKFRELTERSGIDVAANRRQAAVVRKLRKQIADAKGRRTLYGFLIALGFIGAAVAFAFLGLDEGLDEAAKAGCLAGGIAGAAFGIWMIFLYGGVNRRIGELEDREREERRKAWEQMEPLNRLYTWDMTVKLIEATVPRLAFDPYFTAKRLDDLKRIYDWDDSFNDGKSIVFAQSGVINGNPFIIGEYLEQDWEMATYDGYLEISWGEREKGPDGKYHWVTKHDTLHATVEKPKPVYLRKKLLIYGNDAAPNLTFTREPSGLDDNDLFDGIRAKWRLHKLKEFSRNLKDESQFTLMGNHEFETWFHAKDRNDEVEFRLLFTALAQTQLMALMKDLKTGFGDDFSFVKDRKLNYLYPRHLELAEIDTDPDRFRDWDYDNAAHTFIEFNEKYFRDVYFALAPLLAIPVYQQTRTHEEIWKDVIDADGASFWEHEATANYFGGARFEHPDCITENILKTAVRSRQDGVSDVRVTAYGFRGEKHVDYVEVYGGDGKCHDVPVEWTEYLPVTRTSSMVLTESAKPADFFSAAYARSPAAAFRRSIRSFLHQKQ